MFGMHGLKELVKMGSTGATNEIQPEFCMHVVLTYARSGQTDVCVLCYAGINFG